MNRKPRWKRALLYMGVYLLGLFTPVVILALGNPYSLFFAAMFRGASEEIVRTTSPDGMVDAVQVR
jgi:hypothetical protein